MAFVFHDEGESWNLEVCINKVQARPESFFLGLCSQTLVDNSTLSSISEVYGGGYARKGIIATSPGIAVSEVDSYHLARLPAVTWIASGAAYQTVNRVFLTTVLSGMAAPLIASDDIDAEVTLADGDSMTLTSFDLQVV